MSKQAIYGIEILDKQAIKDDQDGIKTVLGGLDLRVHANAIQCMIHAEIHGDTSLMRRLLVDTITEVTGYRRQGLINWMKKFSPMELKGKDNLDLSGVVTDDFMKSLAKQFPDLKLPDLKEGDKRPWLIEQANKTPFWTDKDNAERVAKPVYRDAILGKFDLGIREFEAAFNNTTTAQGKAAPIDATKPYYDGVQVDKALEFFQSMKNNVTNFRTAVKDDTREVRNAQATLRKALNGVDPATAKAMLGEVLGPTTEKAPVLETEAA